MEMDEKIQTRCMIYALYTHLTAYLRWCNMQV